MRRAGILVGAILTLGILGGSPSYAEDITRTPLQTWQIPQTAPYDISTLLAVIKAGGTSGRHAHPGAELTYVVSGRPILKIDGKADKALKAGDSFTIAPGAVHEVVAQGSEPVVLVLSYVTERGKPLISQLP
jgi:mannose-6-phosphate isomerase-like protein (cupin superfamily)